jgi:mono/diheme cytochrome c family protein
MNRRARLAALALLAASAAACGSSTPTGARSRVAHTGAQIFTSAGCAGCHTLAAAHATGRVGPNLDDLKPTAPTVRRQVTNGGSAMPAFKDTLSARQIETVAAYVARVAGHDH